MARLIDQGPLRIGDFAWKESTRNHWVAYLDDCASIEVYRSRSWKRYQPEKPWRITVFGNCHAYARQWFEDHNDAMYFAEREAIDRLGRLATRLGMVHPPLVKAPKQSRARR